jgi:hypothetical protein
MYGSLQRLLTPNIQKRPAVIAGRFIILKGSFASGRYLPLRAQI